ncbi:TPA: response regulator transcription factor [Campylobacter fetus subsp. venerealis]|uniref:response regulator transcription factor n=1 Tax=Campylobacter fetus TaxID=196 RepID=UPI00190DC4C8|nr:response regulator transcription factor [Campylobacter fetus]MBK3486175.1 response regulator transcription factor [Campylobacter fetus subsp. venerealis]HDX6255080.1 response regulator transcription factor [Campylobacter fetus subsp. venerealis]HDX6280441.1 response regulator transcription factor [Campylobacter fetus subsp. venerealis]HDX6282384.1 response regulator transcription factor [Campylobacter fetus subsp. venerealis]HDX6284347.1 response regulator transcription factor [Campylobacte
MSDILKSLTVLFVEDEDKIRTSMGSAMEGIFAKVILAGNGDEGLKKFKKFNPDVIVTDISMPIMDGLDMSKEIRDISKDTPIVILSAFSEKEKLLKAIEIGIDKYIIKPIDMEELFEAISVLAQDKISTTNIVKIGGGYSFNKTKRVLVRNQEEIALTKKELAFISILVKRLGTLVLHEEIKNSVWVGEKVSDAAIRTFIKRIRDKVGANLIKNIPGLGYKIETNL